MTVTQAATLLGVNPTTLRRWDHDGTLSAVRTDGGHRRYPLDEVLALRQTRLTDRRTLIYTYPIDRVRWVQTRQTLVRYCEKHQWRFRLIGDTFPDGPDEADQYVHFLAEIPFGPRRILVMDMRDWPGLAQRMLLDLCAHHHVPLLLLHRDDTSVPWDSDSPAWRTTVHEALARSAERFDDQWLYRWFTVNPSEQRK